MKEFIVYRKDIGTNKSEDKKNLFRLTVIDNKVVIDINNNLKGKGFYIKKDINSINVSIDKLKRKYKHQDLDIIKKELILLL